MRETKEEAEELAIRFHVEKNKSTWIYAHLFTFIWQGRIDPVYVRSGVQNWGGKTKTQTPKNIKEASGVFLILVLRSTEPGYFLCDSNGIPFTLFSTYSSSIYARRECSFIGKVKCEKGIGYR